MRLFGMFCLLSGTVYAAAAAPDPNTVPDTSGGGARPAMAAAAAPSLSTADVSAEAAMRATLERMKSENPAMFARALSAHTAAASAAPATDGSSTTAGAAAALGVSVAVPTAAAAAASPIVPPLSPAPSALDVKAVAAASTGAAVVSKPALIQFPSSVEFIVQTEITGTKEQVYAVDITRKITSDDVIRGGVQFVLEQHPRYVLPCTIGNGFVPLDLYIFSRLNSLVQNTPAFLFSITDTLGILINYQALKEKMEKRGISSFEDYQVVMPITLTPKLVFHEMACGCENVHPKDMKVKRKPLGDHTQIKLKYPKGLILEVPADPKKPTGKKLQNYTNDWFVLDMVLTPTSRTDILVLDTKTNKLLQFGIPEKTDGTTFNVSDYIVSSMKNSTK